MRLILASLLALAAPATAVAQPAQPARQATTLGERMAPFGWLVGEWRGSGWALSPDGSRHTFESRETVTPRLSGNALLVEGRHSAAGRLMHDAMAMITWDARAGAYRFRSAMATGMGGDFPITPTANGFSWQIDTPGGRIDYVVTHENGVWTERGRRTGADGQSVDFFEMTLRRE